MLEFPRPQPGHPALVLAPMEGITDAPMRATQTAGGSFSFCVTEFLRVCQQPVPDKVFFRHLPELKNQCLTPHGTPVQLQLLGGDPAFMALVAQRAQALGVNAIDLNFGCPAPTVNRNDGGAVLLRNPSRIFDVVAACRSALPPDFPLSAKLRLGWDTTDTVHEAASLAAQAGASWITLHGRTRMAGYQPPIHWEPIGRVRAELHPLPVVANGDIWSLEDFARCQEITGCEHYMLGRGALVNPALASAVAAALGLAAAQQVNAFSGQPLEWAQLFERLQGYAAHEPPDRIARRMKQWGGYAKRYGAAQWFDRIKRLPTPEAILEVLQC